MDVIDLTKKLISCPSVTPKDAGAQNILREILEGLGFTCTSLPFGEGEERVENLFARIGTGAPHLCYAGHTDVVPAGKESEWTFGAFTPDIQEGILYGRGASDMKGSVAAFACAAAQFIKNGAFRKDRGSISMLITGDEEGPAINGTVRVLEWMAQNGHTPDMALVGEPTNPDHLGQEIKVGRRGSLNGYLTVRGKQGHVAYQHLADNPIPRLINMLDALTNHIFDRGSTYFSATNLEITTIDVGNPATNVIPAAGRAEFNVRFNDKWNRDTLEEQIIKLCDRTGGDYDIKFEGNADSFITKPAEWSGVVKDAVKDITGLTPEYTTNGGTSDARFIVNYCPVIECGGVNKTIHQINENARVKDLKDIEKIYLRILERTFS